MKGGVWSWGDNNWGQLGTDQTINRLPMPVELPVQVPVMSVFAGGTHSGFLTHKFNMKASLPLQRGEFLSNLKYHVTKNDSLGREVVQVDQRSDSAKQFDPPKTDSKAAELQVFPRDLGVKNALNFWLKLSKFDVQD